MPDTPKDLVRIVGYEKYDTSNDLSLPAMDRYVLDTSNSAAVSMMRKLTGKHLKPGSVIPVSHDEFEALKNAVIRIEFPAQKVDDLILSDEVLKCPECEVVLTGFISSIGKEVSGPFWCRYGRGQIRCGGCGHIDRDDAFLDAD